MDLQKAIEALEKARKTDSGYNTPEVNAALREMFHGKCYICENKEAASYQIEHLAAHRGNLNLKYDWQNLSDMSAIIKKRKMKKRRI